MKLYFTKRIISTGCCWLFTLLAAFTLFRVDARAQSTANYAFATNASGSLEDMSSGTTQLLGSGLDDNASAVTNIGFDFWFMGARYTQFSVNTNGLVRLGATVVGTTANVQVGSVATTALISAFSLDMETGATGKVHYKVTGTAPNRTLVIEWSNMLIGYDATVEDGVFQVSLSETSGMVVLTYGNMVYRFVPGTTTVSAGIQSSNVNNTYATVNINTNAVTTTGGTTNYGLGTVVPTTLQVSSAANGSRRNYRFTPPAVSADPTGLTFASVAGSSMTLNWTDNATNELSYLIYRSTDNVNFTNVGQVAANVATYAATGLNFGTTYYWRVVGITEGALSAPASGSQMTIAPSFSGTKTIGTGGDYDNLTTAFAAINASGLTANVDLQLIAGYPASPETYPILSANAAATGTYAINVYPTVSGLSITSANATGTLSMNGAGNITFDGRVNQTGAADLVIANTNLGTSPAIQLINEAKNNTFKYCMIQSVNNSTTSGTIVFGGTTGTTGNDNNTIDNCDIRDGATTPFNAIYSAGTSASADNSGNTVSACNIYNYYAAGSNSNGIAVASNSAAWTITGNKLYQTATRTATTGNQYRGILINTSAGGGYTVSNNTIGFASSTGTGVTTYGGAFANRFFGVEMSVAATPVSSIQGNTISGIVVSTTSGSTTSPGIFSGISVPAGSVNIGTVTGNTIGAATGAGAIAITSTNTSNAYGITVSGSAGNVDIRNNTVGAVSFAASATFIGINGGSQANLTMTGNTVTGNATTGASTTITGMTGTGSTALAVTNNTVTANATSGTTGTVTGISGGTSTNSVITGNSVTSNTITATGSGTMTAINGAGPTTLTMSTNTITGNTLNAATGTFYGLASGTTKYTFDANMIHDNAIAGNSGAGASVMYGIYNLASPTIENITNNQIYNLSIAGATTSTSSLIMGIQSNTVAASVKNFSGNLIHTLQFSNSAAGTATVNGISTLSGTTINVFRNKIYDLSAGGAGSLAHGVVVGSGVTVSLYNNTIGDLRAPVATNTVDAIKGLNITGGTTVNAYYNTIYLDGVSTGANFGSTVVNVVTGTTLNLRNNILINNSTPAGTGVASVMRRSTTTLTSYASTSNNNLFYAGAPGASHVIMHDGTAAYQAISAFQTLVGPTRDVDSRTENVSFLSTTGSSASFLHVNTATPTFAESGAVNIAGITDDFDGEAREGNPGYAGTGTKPDMGADEFEGSPVPQCTGMPVAGTITGPAAVCTGLGTTLNLTNGATEPGTSYQWASSATAGGPYTSLGTVASQATGSLTAPVYYIVTTTCVFSGLSAVTPEIMVGVNALPPVAVTPTSAVYCVPGNAITLAATGAATYAWTPATGLSAATGASVDATPANTTTYTVTGTDANGCVATATTVIGRASTPVLTAAATPATVCSGANSQLEVTATIPVTTYTVTSIPYAEQADPGTPVNLVSGDDAVSTAQTLPFTFKYYGADYTSVSMYSNGFVQLGTSSSTTAIYAQSLPATAAPNNIIAGVYSDLNILAPTGGQTPVTAYTTGTAPNRIYTIYYHNVKYYTSAAGNVTGNISFQIQLHETSNIIDIHVGEATGVSTTTANKTLGIENSTGVYAATPAGRNAADWSVASASPEAWRFVPVVGNFTYAWTPATFLDNASIANPLATAVTSSTAYTVTVTEASGCAATATASVTAGVALTAVPAITPSNAVCAGANITLHATPAGGGLPYAFSWTGPNGFTSTVENPALAAVTAAMAGTYSVTITDNCGASTTATVVLTVNALPAVAVTPATATFCTGTTPVSLTASGAATYAWGPATGLSAVVGTTVDASPLATTTYTVTGTDGNGCVSLATAVITSIHTPAALTVTPAAPTLCESDIQVLNMTGGTIGGTAIIGTGTNVNGTTGYPAPYSNYYGGTKHQMIIRSSELTAAGLVAGVPITSIAFTVTAVGTTFTGNLSAFQISMKNTTTNVASSSSYEPGMTLVYGPVTQAIPTSGFPAAVTHNITPFAWDGTSNIIVETSYSNANSGTTNDFVQMANTDPGFLSTSYNRADGATPATILSNTTPYGTTNARPNMKLVASQPTTIVWSPASDLYTDASATVAYTGTSVAEVYAKPAATTTYTVSSSNGVCSVSGSAVLTVNTRPVVNAGTDVALCAGQPATLTAAGDAVSYAWDHAVVDNVAFTPAATTTYTLTGTAANGCTKTDQVLVTVNALPAVNAGTDVATCTGSAVTLSGTGAVSYSWNNSVTNGVAFTPGATDTYTVTGTDGNGCINTDAVTVTVNPIPVVDANADFTVCQGVMITLNGTGATTYVWDHGITDNVPFAATTTTTYNVVGTSLGCSSAADVVVTVLAAPALNAGTDVAVCTGGSVTLTATGDGPFTWDNSVVNGVSFTPATTTTYTVTATNGICTSTDMVIVTVNALPVVHAGNDTAVCAGQPIILFGTGAATYAWNGGQTNNVAFVPSGDFTYIVTGTDANGCVDTDDRAVTVNALPAVDGGLDVSVCAGSQAALTATGAGTFSWDNGISQSMPFTPMATTTYTVTVDNGTCTNTDEVVVTVIDLPAVNAGANTAVCAGNSVVLTATGDGIFTWNNGITNGVAFTPATTNTYIVTATEASCTNTDTVLVTVNALPVATTTATNGITLTAAPAGQTYQWINCATNTPVAGAVSATFTATVNGSYAVIVTNGSGCSDTSACATISEVGLKEQNAAALAMALYPNPTSGKVFIQMDATEQADITVYDAQGKVVYVMNRVKDGAIIDLGTFQTGVYMVKISTEKGTSMDRILKN